MCVRGASMSTSTTWCVCGITTAYTDTHVVCLWGENNNTKQEHTHMTYCGVATSSRLLKIIRLFCKRALWKRRYSANKTCNFKESTNGSHPIRVCGITTPHTKTRIHIITDYACVCSCVCCCNLTHTDSVNTHKNTHTYHYTVLHVVCIETQSHTQQHTHTSHGVIINHTTTPTDIRWCNDVCVCCCVCSCDFTDSVNTHNNTHTRCDNNTHKNTHTHHDTMLWCVCGITTPHTRALTHVITH